MKDNYRFNLLLEFESDRSFMSCEEIVKKMSEDIPFDHDELIERYDREDKAYDYIMHMQADPALETDIRNYLDSNGFKDEYHIYRRLAN